VSGGRRVDDNSGPRRWLALALLGTAFFMVILDATSVYVAIPTIEAELGFSAGSVQWVTSAYLIAFGGLQLLGGRSADLLGRRRVFMVGVGLFVSSSLACGLAWSAEVLIAARVVQGVSAAIMAPTALSILMTIFAEGPERNKALGIWGGIGGVGATAGLLVGGLITDGLGWEWVFYINVPIGLSVLVMSPSSWARAATLRGAGASMSPGRQRLPSRSSSSSTGSQRRPTPAGRARRRSASWPASSS
jgi:MFS family permease